MGCFFPGPHDISKTCKKKKITPDFDLKQMWKTLRTFKNEYSDKKREKLQKTDYRYIEQI